MNSGYPLTVIDNYILDSEELDGMEQIAYTQLKKYSSKNNQCFPCNQTLCVKLKWSENTVRKVLKSLETKGFISIQRRFNNSNKYELLAFPNFLEQAINNSMENDKNAISLVFDFYKKNINSCLGSLERDSLISWLDRFKGDSQVIIKAISIAVSENARTLNYIQVILLDWYANEIKTIEEVNRYIDSRVSRKRFTNGSPKVDSFNDYKQREYDFDDLERKLLGRDN